MFTVKQQQLFLKALFHSLFMKGIIENENQIDF